MRTAPCAPRGGRFLWSLCCVGVIAVACAADALSLPPGGVALECASWPPYVAERIETYGDYTVCVWKSLDEGAPGFYRVVTIDRG
jgi:hypothetical protein